MGRPHNTDLSQFVRPVVAPTILELHINFRKNTNHVCARFFILLNERLISENAFHAVSVIVIQLVSKEEQCND